MGAECPQPLPPDSSAPPNSWHNIQAVFPAEVFIYELKFQNQKVTETSEEKIDSMTKLRHQKGQSFILQPYIPD